MSIVRDIIKQFDSSDELAQVQREVVESLARVAEGKADIFDVQIRESLRTAGKESNQTVPITAVLASKKEVHAYSSTSAEHISQVVQESLASFLTQSAEGVVSGIGKLISGALTVFLGNASASTGSTDEYYVLTEGLSIVRVDLKAWYLNVSSASVYAKMERVSAFVAVKSAVDLSRLDFNTFLYLYQKQLQLAQLSKEEVLQALKDAKEIFAAFGGLGRPGDPAHVTVHPATRAALPA